MPIHDQSYRHYGGGKAVAGRAWLVIAGAGIRTVIRKRVFLGLLRGLLAVVCDSLFGLGFCNADHNVRCLGEDIFDIRGHAGLLL